MSDPESTERYDCAETRRRASLYMDGRLRAASRQLLQDHLLQCADCMVEYGQFHRLSKAVGELPRREAVADLSISVRETVAERRRGVLSTLGRDRRRVVVVAAAAILLSTVAWFIGYGMGASSSDADGAGDVADEREATGPSAVQLDLDSERQTLVVARQALATERRAFEVEKGDLVAEKAGLVAEKAAFAAVQKAPPRATDANFASFERAARGLLGDIELISDVAPRGRRPLVAAQLEYFAMRPRAEQILLVVEDGSQLYRSAGFVRDLSSRMAVDDLRIDWRQVQENARRCRPTRARLRDGNEKQLGTRRLRPRDESAERGRIRSVVDEVGGDLDGVTRTSLLRLLSLKDGFVRGRVDESVRYADSISTRGGSTIGLFDLPTGVIVIRTLSEAGLRDKARPVFTRMSTTISRVTSRIRSDSRRTTAADAIGDSVARMLDRVMREIAEDLKRGRDR